MWTLAKDLFNDLNANTCKIDDVMNFSSSLFTHLVDSFNSNFVEERSNIYIINVHNLLVKAWFNN